MKLIFKKLEIHSFMPFEDEVFEFDKMNGFTLVKGINHDIPDETNGAGKSCMFTALLYVLFGEVQDKLKNEYIVNRYASDKDMRISLTFNANNSNYRIVRGLNKGKQSYIELYENDTDITKSSIAETQKFLETELIKCNAATFSRTMFLTSNKTYNFYEMKKSDKKEFIEQLFDIGIFGDMYTAIHRDILDADKRILSIQNRLMVFKKNESDYDERLKKYDNDRAARILAIDSDIELAKNKLADARNAYKKVDVSARDKLDVAKDKLNNALKLLEKQYKEFNTEEIKFETAKNKLNQIIESRQAIISKHSDIMTKLCNDCKPIFANHYMLDKYQDEIIDANEKIEKIKIKISDIKTKITEISDKRQKIDEKISEIDIRIRKMISESAEAARIVATAEAKLLSVEKEKNKLESEKNPYIELLESNKKNMDNENTVLLNEADSYKYLKSAENIVSHDTLRKFIISDLIGLLNNKIKTYLTRLGSRYTVEFDSDMNYEFITTGGKCEFNNFSAGERMRIMIATSFAFRDFMSIRNGLTSNVLVLDEYFDSAISSSGVRRVIDLLEDYVKEGQNVFIISHRSEVDQDIFDRIITVEKKNDISKITYNN